MQKEGGEGDTQHLNCILCPETFIYVFVYVFWGSCDNSSVGMTGLVLH